MTKKKFIEIEQSRAAIFNIFTALFCQPEEEILKGRKIFKVLKEAFEITNIELLDDLKEIKTALKKYSNDELLVEYTKLFLGPFKVLAPPYSSIYFGHKQLMSKESVWVADFYNQAQLKFNRDLKDLPDHVAVETEFLYFLIYNELKELQEKNTANAKDVWANQSIFFEKHYKEWIPKFCKQIKEQSVNEFYIALANCFSKFVETVALPKFPVTRVSQKTKTKTTSKKK